MRSLIIEGVRPNRRMGRRRYEGWIVDEAELRHHEELAVPSQTEERYSQTFKMFDRFNNPMVTIISLWWTLYFHTSHVFQSHTGEPIDDVGLSDHLVEPVLERRVLHPPILRAPMAADIYNSSAHYIVTARNNNRSTYVTECMAISWPRFHRCWTSR